MYKVFVVKDEATRYLVESVIYNSLEDCGAAPVRFLWLDPVEYGPFAPHHAIRAGWDLKPPYYFSHWDTVLVMLLPEVQQWELYHSIKDYHIYEVNSSNILAFNQLFDYHHCMEYIADD